MKRALVIGLAALLSGSAALADPVLRWSPADTTIAVGDQTTLSVLLDDTLTVRTIELYIEYDPALVTSISGGFGALFDGFNNFAGFQVVSPGRWHGWCVILGAHDWTVGPGELFEWTVRGDVEGICAITTAEVTLLPPGGGDYTEVELPGTTLAIGDDLTAVGPPASGGLQLSLSPNPFNPATDVTFRTGGHPRARLEVHDARGRRVAVLADGLAADGACRWDGRDDCGRSLPSGIYTFVLTADDGARVLTRGALLR